MHIVDHLQFVPESGDITSSNKYNGAAQVSGTIRAALSDRLSGIMRQALGDLGKSDAEFAPPVFTGKSGPTHGGLHIDPDWAAAKLEKNKTIVVPANVVSLLPQDWLTSFLAVSQLSDAPTDTFPERLAMLQTRVSIGRILCYRNAEILTAAELREELESKHSIRFGQKVEIEEQKGIGILKAGIHPRESFVLDNESLTSDRMEEIIKHGRSTLEVLQYLRLWKKDKSVQPGHMHTGVTQFSTIEHPFLVRPDLNGQGMSFLSAPYYDPMRSTGIGSTMHGKRPVTMFNGTNQAIETSSIQVPFVALKPQKENIPVPIRDRSPSATDRVHADGMKFADILPIHPDNLRRWFAGITPHPHEGGQAAVIVSRNGVTPVPWAPTYTLHKTRITSALEGGRFRDPNCEDIRQVIPLTNATGRAYIGHHLPSSSHLEALSRDGVKVFIFRGISLEKQIFDDEPDPRPLNNFYMTNTTHQKLMELEKQGCQFIWWPVSNNGDEKPREFYKGMFVLPNAKDRYDRFRDGGTGIAMFGSAVPGLEEEVRDDIYQFGHGLKSDLSGYGEIAILEGGGPSLMQVAREMAQQQGFMNISYGVDFEKAAEIPNMDSEAVVHFASDQIEYRQTLFEMMQLIPIFNIGGKGTWYEQVLSFLNQGLERFVPTPLILINKNDFWKGTIDQIKMMTDTTRFTKPPTKPWQKYMVKDVQDYEQARTIIRDFIEDPTKAWKAAGITPEHIRNAQSRHQATAENMHLTIPSYLTSACDRFCT